MKFVDLALSSWTPNINADLFRPAPRHALDRDVNYEDRFDFTTIIYDAFWSESGEQVIVICPPPYNVKGSPFGGAIFELPSGRACEIEVANTGPVHILHVPVSPGTTGLRLDFPLGTYHVAPQPNLCADLKGERLLIAHSKNNSLQWIRDWAYFHVKMHGCTGVLFYDNGSDRYHKYDVRAALDTVPGLKHAVLVDAPFPFGAINGPFGINDSRYFQRAYLEHAKYRLYGQAASVVHVDIDELVMSANRESIFEAVEGSRTGCVSFEGVWVERVTDDGVEPAIDDNRHAVFRSVAAGGGRRSLRKSAVAPPKVGHAAYITTHRVYGAKPDYLVGDRFKHRHFMGLKTVETNIKNKARLDAEPFLKFDPELHERDPVLNAQLDEVFGSEEYRRMPRVAAYAVPRDGDVCRRFAGVKLARGDLEGAIEWTLKAIELQPSYPSYHKFLARLYEAAARPEEAAAAAGRAQELLATSPENRVVEVKKLRSARRPQDAERAVDALLAEFPNHADAHVQRGELHVRRRDFEAAAAAFARAVELDPEDHWKRWRLGSHQVRAGRLDEAVETFRAVVATPRVGFANRLRTYTSLIAALESAGRPAEALAAADEAIAQLGEHHKLTTAGRDELCGHRDRLRSQLGAVEAGSFSPAPRAALDGLAAPR